MKYNWQHPKWPHFIYDLSDIESLVQHYLIEAGQTLGIAESLGSGDKEDILLDLMVEESLKTSQIEGEDIQIDELRSSLRSHMGLSIKGYQSRDPRAKGITQLMLAVRSSFKEPLTVKMLFEWHDFVLQDPRQTPHMEIGKWRTDPSPMQIVSGAIGREIVFFEAPPSHHVPFEMKRFIKWFNATSPSSSMLSQNHLKGLVRSAIAHLYFESIHPFSDGNGRVGRAIAEKALSQDLGQPVFLSLSKILYQKRKAYYEALSHASGPTLEITEWLTFFIECVLEAQKDAKETFMFVVKKAKFWQKYADSLNERQTKALRRMFDEGKSGFKGGMTSRKYITITNCSKATATRDLSDLLTKGCFSKSQDEGRSTFYTLRFNDIS